MRRAVLIPVAVSVVLGLLVGWFAWPATQLEPRGLPIVVTGPPVATSALTQRLESARPGAFQVTSVPDAAAADAALRDREAYAALVLGPDGVSLHTASAASPAVATLLAQAVQQLAPTGQVTVVDVVPGGPDDARGTGFASGFLPLVLAGMVAGILLALLVASKVLRLVGLLVFAPVAGLVSAAMLAWLGITDGAYLSVAASIGLLAFAMGATVAGFASLLGRAGIALGVLVVFLFANPIAGVNAAPELLPEPWGAIGQLLPAGAGVRLVRGAAFFDWAGSAAALWTLFAWAAVGITLLLVGKARILESRPHPAEEPHPA
jgi:hypothetical protein